MLSPLPLAATVRGKKMRSPSTVGDVRPRTSSPLVPACRGVSRWYIADGTTRTATASSSIRLSVMPIKTSAFGPTHFGSDDVSIVSEVLIL